jgi:hypothetical protein
MPRLFQQPDHLVVGCLLKLLVNLADAPEKRRDMQANDLVRMLQKKIVSLGRSDRHGGDHARRTLLRHGAKRGAHRRSRRRAVVHQNDDPVPQIRRRLVKTIQAVAALQLLRLFRQHPVDVVLGNGRVADGLVIENANIRRRQSAHRQFLLPRQAQLAYQHQVQRRMQSLRDLESDGHAAAGQGQHDHVVALDPRRQLLRQMPSGIVPVVKPGRHHALICMCAACPNDAEIVKPVCESLLTSVKPFLRRIA